jgi:A/G-specific adenine glycosylase
LKWRRISGVLKPRFETDVLAERKAFRDALVRWFSKNGKDYPWRRTKDPYEVLVSEVMLQQTQIATVLGKGYYTGFLAAFPDVRMLADADDAALLKAWEGLGYYRRVRMLRETARAVIADHDGRFPADADVLMKLPGIGRYTAGALRAFAFGLPAVLVDGNVARVLSRVMDFQDPVDDAAGIRRIWAWAEELADARRARAYHAALMELGQTVCRSGVPDCLNCPVAGFCKTVAPERLPLKGRKTAITAVDEHALWLRDAMGRLLLHHEGGKRRTGLWKLPVREAAELAHLPVLAEQRYAITRYKVNLRVHDGAGLHCSLHETPGDAWKTPDEVAALAMAAPFRRVVERLSADF